MQKPKKPFIPPTTKKNESNIINLLTMITSNQQYQLTRQLCALNNQGVASLERNAHGEAVLQFVECLLIGKELSKTMPQFCDVSVPEDSLRCCGSSILSKGCTEDNLFLYQSPLLLSEKCCSTNQTAIRVYTSVVVFNLALLHHHLGAITGKTRSLAKAEQLYKTSIEILSELNPLTYHETTLLIVMAANNNLAQIDLERGMVLTVNGRFRYMSRILHECSAKYWDAFDSFELDGVLSNILLLGCCWAASPAA